jgi:hypothetical protein
MIISKRRFVCESFAFGVCLPAKRWHGAWKWMELGDSSR